MAADTFACISQYVALATGDCDVLADGVVFGRLALGHHEDRTPTHGYAATREEAGAQPRRHLFREFPLRTGHWVRPVARVPQSLKFN